MIRRTRIVCTIGPSSSSPAVLRNLIQSGMDVARVDANKWLIDTRGAFSGLFANDLLVMMDGRTLALILR